MATIALAATLPAAALSAQSVHPTPPPEVTAVRLREPIQLDGRLDEAVWHEAPAATGFRQSQPHEGQPATQRTEVRFAYDQEALYVGARMYDDSGARGVRTRLVRRDDNPNSDYLQVIFDTYHDHIGRLFFLVNPSGVKNDANGLGGGSDASWDPVWEVATQIDSLGWTAEMRIPFAELRYRSSPDPQTWGLQIWRQENRLNELTQWSWGPLTATGGPSMCGHLEGLVIAHAPGRGELLPYTVGSASSTPVSNAADPFEHAHGTDGRIGADATVLLTSNLTVNATVNPDFGQVEVDPAVVNLTAFETFFQEKRPFFVEGGSYFGFDQMSCFFCSNVSSLNLFYSRRIGRAPEAGDAAYATGLYASVPTSTGILGAAKLTGRTQSGWSIGVLDAATQRVQAPFVDSTGAAGVATVEPASNYFVGRLAKDFGGGATQVVGMATSVTRNLNDPYLRDHLNAHAESFGLATDSWWGNRTYHLMAQVAGTQVSGDTADIGALQRTSAHYFQRPDRAHGANGFLTNHYDSTLTVMRGLGAYARVAKDAGNWLWEVSTNVRTPGFENNDLAFLSEADYWWMAGNVMRMWVKPTRWYRQLMFIAGGQQRWNFEGDRTDRQGQLFGQITTLNYWNLSGFWITKPTYLDDRLSRGGPVLMQPSYNVFSLNVGTDSRRAVVLQVSGQVVHTAYGEASSNASVSAQLKPRSNVSLTVGPAFSHNENLSQYVTANSDTAAKGFYGSRYIFGRLIQNTVSMETRLNVTFTPVLTLDLYVQPLISSGRYADYREFAAPRSLKQLVYGRDMGSVSVDTTGGANLVVLHPTTPTAGDSIVFDRPDFTVRSLRGNAVLRWEYHPGSTLYLVWTRSAASSLLRGTMDFGTDAADLLRVPSDNVFLLKLSYRIGL